MKLKGTDTNGSFKAWGIGFLYIYDAKEKKLHILHAQSERPFIAIDFDDALSKRPDLYVRILEKTSQIKALVYSNNTTINLSETMDDKRLSAILMSAATLARYGYDLMEDNFSRFAETFGHDFSLRKIELHCIAQKNDSSLPFAARLETRRSNEVKVQAATLPALLLALSDQIIRDIITLEFGYGEQSTAHLLLSMTSKLSELSFILNDRFSPEKKIAAAPEKSEKFN